MTSQPLESALQETLFLAIREGNLEGMMLAYEKGADPHKPHLNLTQLENTSIWLYASIYAPLSTLKEVCALLETWGVGRRYGPSDVSGSHPCIELTLRTSMDVFSDPGDKVQKQRAIYDGHTLAWDLWETLSKQERRRVLLTLDACAAHQGLYLGPYPYKKCLERIWNDAPFLEEFESWEFDCIRTHLHTKTLSPQKMPSDSSLTAAVPEESIFWCLQSLFLNPAGGIRSEFNSGDPLRWGIHLLTAPEHVLKECLENKSLRALMMTLIMEKIKAPLPDLLKDYTRDYYENIYLQLVQRFHTLGVSWPEVWPAALRAKMLKLPSIRRFEEQQILTHMQEHEGAPSSSPRPRL